MSVPRRLHAPSLEGPRVELGAESARHARVLRLRVGDPVVLFDGRGHEADATIALFESGRLVCAIARVRSRPPGPRVILVQALPKGAKLDEIVRACTECGVTAIHLALVERSLARPGPERGAARLERLTRIAAEAARQAERADVPAIVAPAPLAEVAARAPASAARLAFCARGGSPWDAAITDAEEVWLAVGPEGGLSPAEERALAACGWRLVHVATPILRVETAAPVAVALLVDRLGRR